MSIERGGNDDVPNIGVDHLPTNFDVTTKAAWAKLPTDEWLLQVDYNLYDDKGRQAGHVFCVQKMPDKNKFYAWSSSTRNQKEFGATQFREIFNSLGEAKRFLEGRIPRLAAAARRNPRFKVPDET